MYQQNGTGFYEDVKYDNEYSLTSEEDKPPSLVPPEPINQFRNQYPTLGTRYSRPVNGRRFDPYDRDMNYSSVERYNEEVSIRFLFGNGRPLSTIDDPHFKKFLHYLNPTRAAPEAGNMTTKAMSQIRPDINYHRLCGPLAVTIEAIRKSDEIYLTISAHCYTEYGERQNTIHFEKIIIADYEGKVVADRIRKVVDARKSMNFGVSYILSPNVRMLAMVAANMPFKNKFVCFFSYITNIAREVIAFPEFENGLKLLREYVEALNKHREVFTKYKKMQLDSNNTIDIPVMDSESDWLSTLHFLSICSQNHESFSNLHENWCMPKYLDEKEENAMSNLYDFLVVLCHITTQICSEDSCISQVLYSMSIINNAIKNCGIQSARVRMRKTFVKFYNQISKGKIGDFYTISTLLDPRYGYSSMIFSDENWTVIEQKLVTTVGVTPSTRFEINKELKKYKKLHENLPNFDEVTTQITWWNENQEQLPLMYRQWVEHSALPAVSIDAKQYFAKGGKLAHLFAALDEEMHFKALLLAQSSQDFIGRGNASHAVYNNLKDGNKFKRFEDKNEDNMEESTVAETEVKQEITNESFGMVETQNVKVEELEDTNP
ncbi:hypothetical protein GCK72_014334 [Caenorhabditis remanei]|uniref:Uncharacterized protein n=1 Tax=Caenorhabditis remanei TaxID=31234 RepID=A0A6A5GRR8_CAERE|nr:hypothetical protein GCK72_014334 [Caenorhabditis remanei]KAF1757877.1 hypothetical protein GCK72_014334 [Caenorhabditis remanei]